MRCNFCPTRVNKTETPGPAYILKATDGPFWSELEFIETFCFALSQFLQCSKLVYQESVRILYGENTFWHTNACQLKNFVRECSHQARSSIHNLMSQYATRFKNPPSKGGPDLKLLPNLKKLKFYDYSHSDRPFHNPSTEWDGLLIDTNLNGEYRWCKDLEKGNPGDEFLRRLYNKYPSIECGILVNQQVCCLWLNRDYWVSLSSPEPYR